VTRLLLAALAAFALAACGDAGDAPLGGPFGGNGPYTPPTPDSGSGPEPDSSFPDPDGGSESGSSAPTWTEVFDRYLAPGTIGRCGECHSETRTAKGMYSFFLNQDQIKGTSSPLVSADASELSWFGGFMPLGGTSSAPEAQRDMKAWVAAGALEN
jgi:hypothetical protein